MATTRWKFDTRAQALASTVPAWVNSVEVDGLEFDREAPGSLYCPLTLADGSLWGQLRDCRDEHFGLVGVFADMRNSVTDTQGRGYLPDPATNEATLLQRALDYALSRGIRITFREDRAYGTNTTLWWGYRSGGPSICYDTAQLITPRFAAMDGSWGANDLSHAHPDWHTYGAPVLNVGRPYSGGIPFAGSTQDVVVDARRRACVGIWFRASIRTRHITPRADRATGAQQIYGDVNAAEPGAVNAGYACTDAYFISPQGREYVFGEQSNGAILLDATGNDGTGYWGLSGRTSHGLVVRSHDTNIANPRFSSCLHSFVGGKSYNCKITGGFIWNGLASSDIDSRTLWVGPVFAYYQFDHTTIDDGKVRIECFDGSFIGCTIKQFAPKDEEGDPITPVLQVELVAHAANETAGRFRFIGNTVTAGVANLIAAGSGSWSDFRGQWFGNVNAGTGGPYTIQGFSVVMGGGFKVEVGAAPVHYLGSTAPTLSANSSVGFWRPSNTEIGIAMRGADGVTRTGTIALT